ncbi:MAG TPA: hypothetical protein VH459_11090 [Gaiellales bacterium]
MKFDLSQFFHRPDANEDWLARYLVTQARRGRRTADVLQDPVVLRRTDAGTRARVLDRSDVIEALAENAVSQVREEIARGGIASRGARPAGAPLRGARGQAAEDAARTTVTDVAVTYLAGPLPLSRDPRVRLRMGAGDDVGEALAERPPEHLSQPLG